MSRNLTGQKPMLLAVFSISKNKLKNFYYFETGHNFSPSRNQKEGDRHCIKKVVADRKNMLLFI